jgi:surface polysaccharide O-acyltransferase-like enzyme
VNYTNNKVIDRQSNFELMRIVSMFMIVVWHIIIHGKVLDNTIGTMHILITMLLFICQVHVSSFILLTGYFQCDKKFKMNNLISIVNAAWFYKMIFTIIFIVVGNFFIPAIDKIFSFIPVDYNNYWFINLYILLYLLSPALNIIINNASKKKLQAIIFIAFFIISILSTFTVQVTYNDKGGTSLGFFILLYFIGAYLKRYPINKNNIYKIFNNNLFFRLLCFFY